MATSCAQCGPESGSKLDAAIAAHPTAVFKMNTIGVTSVQRAVD
jgi:hypothetical protein